MERSKLKMLLLNLRQVLNELEAEVYSNKDSYLESTYSEYLYDEVLKYEETNDDDGED